MTNRINPGASARQKNGRAPKGAADNIQGNCSRTGPECNADAPANKPDNEKLTDKIKALALLNPIDYELQRAAVAKEFSVRPSFLDAEVKKQRTPETKKPHDDLTNDVMPWDGDVSGDHLAMSVKSLFDQYLVLPSGASVALTLWVMASYSINSFRIFPKVLLSSPEKRCGKTTTLEVIDSLAYRSLPASNVSASVLFRAIQAWQPTLLIDEADTFIHGKDELTGVINSGHTKSGAFVLRSQEIEGEWQPVKFSTWTPMILAMIKKPPSTIIDRSVVIELQRKRPDQTVRRVPIELKEGNYNLRRKLARWATDNSQNLKFSSPEVPELSSDRAMDNWRPLLAVADLIGWSDKARRAMVKLSDSDVAELSIEAELLVDIQAALEGKKRIFSDDLVSALIADEDRPWCEWRHGKPMTPNSLSKLLGAYGIKSRQIRIGAEKRRGYDADDFSDVFARYIPDQSGTTVQPASHKAFRDFQNGTQNNPVPLAKRPEPAPDKACTTVPLQNGTNRRVIAL